MTTARWQWFQRLSVDDSFDDDGCPMTAAPDDSKGGSNDCPTATAPNDEDGNLQDSANTKTELPIPSSTSKAEVQRLKADAKARGRISGFFPRRINKALRYSPYRPRLPGSTQ